MKRAAVVCVLAVLVAACGGGSSTHTIKGTVTLSGYGNIFTSDNVRCTGESDSGYDDISANAPVTVLDGKGTIVGTSQLIGDGYYRHSECVFSFTVDDVKDADFYTVKVSHRDGPAYSAKEMDRQHWKVALTIGS